MVINDLGSNNIRKLESIDDPIGDDEYKVAMKCGWNDYHFIRLDENGWYNKCGLLPGLYVDEDIVKASEWYTMSPNSLVRDSEDEIYNFDVIYFAVKKEWDK